MKKFFIALIVLLVPLGVSANIPETAEDSIRADYYDFCPQSLPEDDMSDCIMERGISLDTVTACNFLPSEKRTDYFLSLAFRNDDLSECNRTSYGHEAEGCRFVYSRFLNENMGHDDCDSLAEQSLRAVDECHYAIARKDHNLSSCALIENDRMRVACWNDSVFGAGNSFGTKRYHERMLSCSETGNSGRNDCLAAVSINFDGGPCSEMNDREGESVFNEKWQSCLLEMEKNDGVDRELMGERCDNLQDKSEEQSVCLANSGIIFSDIDVCRRINGDSYPNEYDRCVEGVVAGLEKACLTQSSMIDSCMVSAAITTGDLDLCDYHGDLSIKEVCRELVLTGEYLGCKAEHLQNLQASGLYNGLWYCLKDITANTGDVSYCQMIPDERMRTKCVGALYEQISVQRGATILAMAMECVGALYDQISVPPLPAPYGRSPVTVSPETCKSLSKRNDRIICYRIAGTDFRSPITYLALLLLGLYGAAMIWIYRKTLGKSEALRVGPLVALTTIAVFWAVSASNFLAEIPFFDQTLVGIRNISLAMVGVAVFSVAIKSGRWRSAMLTLGVLVSPALVFVSAILSPGLVYPEFASFLTTRIILFWQIVGMCSIVAIPSLYLIYVMIFFKWRERKYGMTIGTRMPLIIVIIMLLLTGVVGVYLFLSLLAALSG
ncbi:hypothetical protein JW899_03875 [Candidatus Uhrbacteria bacterium]|nr:hypothetical protein [Candidatus Uhrbacteria bacterium]